MSYLVVFLMVCFAYLVGQWVDGDSLTHPIAVAGCTLLAHWVMTR